MGLSKLVDKMKNHSVASVNAADPPVDAGKAPLKKQIYRARYNFGPNFGAVFVGEKWIFHLIFPEGAETELQAAEGNIKELGVDGAREKYENHWKSYVNDDDWAWLHDNGVTAIRLPIGYWNIDGGKYTKGTKFEKVAGVYKNSWDIIKKNYIEPAGRFDIGVLIDIHGLPFGANGNDHSGETNNGKAEFWSKSSAQSLIIDALKFLAGDIAQYENVAGIQIVNEAEFSDSATKQKKYYADAINAIRSVDKSVPVVISDGWWPDQWAKWVQENQDIGTTIGVVVDHHVYRCFDDKDKNKDPNQITQDLEGDLLTNLTEDGSGVDFMVGEWSCVLDGQLFSKAGLDPNDYGNSKRAEFASNYGAKVADLIFKRAGAGCYFWTYKFESGNGGEWDFRQQLHNAFSPPRISVPDENKFNELLENNFKAHSDYWNSQNPKEKYEHECYKEGFTVAWNDNLEFAKQGSLLGRRQALKSARLKEHIDAKGKSKFLWEWEQGYDKGCEEFTNL